MKHSTSLFRSAALMLGLVLSMGMAHAEADNAYHWFFDTFEVYPTGAGTIYVEDQAAETLTEKADAVPADAWKASQEFKTEVFGSSTAYVNGFAKPAEGWVFLGWGTKEAVNQPTSEYSDYDVLSLTSKTSDTDNSVAKYPFQPDTTVYALFSHVTARVDASCSSFGTVEVSPLVNNIGDQVTLKAIPDAGYEATFSHWLAPDGETELKEATLKVNVTEAANYTAFFTSDAVKTLPAPVNGGAYQIVFMEKDADILDDYASALFLNLYNLQADKIYYSEAKSISGLTPTIIYSYSDFLYLPSKDEPLYVDESYIWSGMGLNISDLDGTNIYYAVQLPDPEDWSASITLKRMAADADVPANTMLVAIAADQANELQMAETLTLEPEPEDGEDGVHDVKLSTLNPQPSTIYDLTGRRVAEPSRPGIYLMGGKKVYIRK